MAETEERRRIRFNTALCSGCRTCMYACAMTHGRGADPHAANLHIETDVLGGFLSEACVCEQCDDHQCVRSCAAGALKLDGRTGIYAVDSASCRGCGLCAIACARTNLMPRINLIERLGIASKCDLCGGEPRCVALCPMGALECEEVAQ